MEMALGFRFTAQRFHEIGFVNRLVDADRLMPEAMAMAEHLMSLPPASRVNTVHMMRQMRPKPSPAHQRLGAALHEHDDKRSEEHTSELPSLMRNSYAVFGLKKKNHNTNKQTTYP